MSEKIPPIYYMHVNSTRLVSVQGLPLPGYFKLTLYVYRCIPYLVYNVLFYTTFRNDIAIRIIFIRTARGNRRIFFDIKKYYSRFSNESRYIESVFQGEITTRT